MPAHLTPRWALAMFLVSMAWLAGCSETRRAQEAFDRARASYFHGDFERAAAEATRHAAAWQSRVDSAWRWKFQLLSAEALTMQGKFAEASDQLKEPVPERAGFEQLRAQWLLDRANLEVNRKRDPSALLAELRGKITDSELEVRAIVIEAVAELNRSQIPRARELFGAALEKATSSGNSYYEAIALSNLSTCSRRLNRYEESIAYGLRALAAAEKAGAQRAIASSHGNLGPSLAYLGDFDAALQHETEALKAAERIGAKPAVMNDAGEIGFIYDRAGRVQEAIPQYKRAFDLAQELGLPGDGSRFADNLALAYIKTLQWDAAAEWNERAWALATASKTTTYLPYLMRDRARIAWARGHADEAIRTSRQVLHDYDGQPGITWEAHSLLGEIAADRRRYPEANREFDSALRIIESARADVLEKRNRVTLLSYLIDFYQEYVDVLAKQGDEVGALRVAESSRARVLLERSGRDVQPPRVIDTATLRAFCRQSGQSVLSFWVAPSRSFAWLITSAGVRRFDLPPAKEIEAMVAAYRGAVEHSIADPITEPTGRMLWDKLLAPLAHEIPAGTRLIVIPDGPLHLLNLETVATAGPRPHYWIEDVEITMAPSIAIAMAKSGGPPRAPRPLLLIGAPDYTGTGYPPLPAANAEAEDLKRQFPQAKAVIGHDAVPAAYRNSHPESFSIIHFAAHAEANTERPLESFVVLSRAGESFKLYAQEVIDVPISADLVTLSACHSAGGRAYAGEGLMGFAWAFLHAGARAVVAGLWNVSDDAARELMAKFYAGVAAGQPAATALRKAKLALMEQNRYRKAFYWGAFQTFAGVASGS